MTDEDKAAKVYDWWFTPGQGKTPSRAAQFDSMAEKLRYGLFLFKVIMWLGAAAIAVLSAWEKLRGLWP